MIFKGEEMSVKRSELPPGKSIIFPLERFEHFLNYISIHLKQGCSTSEYSNVDLLIQVEIEENILYLKGDHTEILYFNNLCKINISLFYYSYTI